jgi:hypothetical protein
MDGLQVKFAKLTDYFHGKPEHFVRSRARTLCGQTLNKQLCVRPFPRDVNRRTKTGKPETLKTETNNGLHSLRLRTGEITGDDKINSDARGSWMESGGKDFAVRLEYGGVSSIIEIAK